LNCRLDGVTLVAVMRKPFDVLAEGLVSEKSRDNKTPLELFLAGIDGLPATICAMLYQQATDGYTEYPRFREALSCFQTPA